MKRTLTLGLALIVGATLACKKDEGAAPEGSAKAAAGASGLANPANDAAVVALLKPAIEKCEYGKYGFSSSCAEWKAVTEAETLKDGAADATMVNLLEDSEEKIRWIGADRLDSRGKAYKKDKAMAAKIVAAAEKETSVVVGYELGQIAGQLDVKETGQVDAVQKLAASHKVTQVRKGVVSKMLFHNRDSYFDFVMGLAKNEPDNAVRLAAVSAFWIGTPSGKKEEVCAMWLEQVKSPTDEVSGEAAYLCSFFPHENGCTKQWDPLLGKIEAWAKAGQLAESRHASALNYMSKHKSATPAQKTRAMSIAKAIVENPGNKSIVRGRALQFIGELAPDAKAFAGKYKDDKDFFVKNAAKRILEGKK